MEVASILLQNSFDLYKMQRKLKLRSFEIIVLGENFGPCPEL